VPKLFPKARPDKKGGYRVLPTDRGPGEIHVGCGRRWREHQEAISFHPTKGIRDNAVHDDVDGHGHRVDGDPKNGSRTPLEIVMEHEFGVAPEDLAVREHTPELEQAFEWLSKLVYGEAVEDEPLQKAAEPDNRLWPTLDPAVLYGLTGEVVELFKEHTESDPAALIMQFHLSFGNAIGRSAYFQVESTRHYTNLYGVLVGKSSKSRKGTSGDRIRDLMNSALAVHGGFDQYGMAYKWGTERIQSGLASGEGLVWHIRDEVLDTNKNSELVVKDQGVEDKRLFLDEREFAGCIAVMKKEGSTTSVVVRKGWDGHALVNLSKQSPGRCEQPHISICGHITVDELLGMLDNVSMANGYANRFLFACVKRFKILPFGGEDLQQSDIDALGEKIRTVFDKAYGVEKRFTMDAETRVLWAQVYPELTAETPGLQGMICGRADPQTLRLAMIYAVLDGSDGVIKLPHLKAALALWKYYEDSVRYVFGDKLGDQVADTILQALRNSANGMTRTQISELFGRNKNADKISAALTLLLKYNKVQCDTVTGKTRPFEVWKAK
jgi:hypothetical protein